MKEYIVQAIAQETIDSFDAHNAPELVRCKDCKNERNGFCILNDIAVTPEWLCADGEKEND